ncbi:SEC-C metal-binding domain-containing protein [Luteococcus sp. Sow4_B9]|uniref:SEC-C metal-binding domain-containing protein n=1 Tax=Luteococcus sp. Sow4_B9 TaxID=3438792 RepID=UPI003F9BEE60
MDSLLGGVEAQSAPQGGAIGAPRIEAKGLGERRQPQNLTYSAPDEQGEAEARRETPAEDEYANVGRNEACPCGSGKKFKMCHGGKAR